VTFRSLHQKGFAIYSVPVDRSGAPEELYASEHAVTPGSWSRNGSLLAFSQGVRGKTEIWVLEGTGDAGAEKR